MILRSVALRQIFDTADFVCSCLLLWNIIMNVKVLDMVFLFIIHIRFVKGKLIGGIIRSRSWFQVSSDVGLGQTLLETYANLKITTISYGNVTSN